MTDRYRGGGQEELRSPGGSVGQSGRESKDYERFTREKPIELEVTNFGPIVEAKIDLRPLTVFVGPSNTGKSYLAILIYALHRCFSSDAGPDHLACLQGAP